MSATEAKLLEIPSDLGPIPSKAIPHKRRIWLSKAGKFWIQCVLAGEDPFEAGTRLGLEGWLTRQWVKEKKVRNPKRSKVESPQLLIAPRKSRDQLLNEYFAAPIGSAEARRIMDELKAAPVTVDVSDESDEE